MACICCFKHCAAKGASHHALLNHGGRGVDLDERAVGRARNGSQSRRFTKQSQSSSDRRATSTTHSPQAIIALFFPSHALPHSCASTPRALTRFTHASATQRCTPFHTYSIRACVLCFVSFTCSSPASSASVCRRTSSLESLRQKAMAGMWLPGREEEQREARGREGGREREGGGGGR